MNPLEFIRLQPPFNQLPEEGLRQVEESLEVAHFPAGARILAQGEEPSQHLYLIGKGAVDLKHSGELVGVLEEGELFGFPSLFTRDAPSFDVVAEEEVLAYCWDVDTFRGLMGYPVFAEFFTQKLADRLRKASLHTGLSLPNLDLSLSVGDLVSRPAVFVGRDATVGEAARIMRHQQIGSLLVEGEPLGILTDRDLRRVLAEDLEPRVPVTKIMSAPAKTLPASTTIFEAIRFMAEANIHHLPLMDEGRVIGVVSDTTFLQRQSRSPLQLLRQIERSRNPRDLQAYARELAGIAEGFLGGGLGAREIGRGISALNDALVGTLLRLGEQTLGAPPCRYAWITFGSEGRMEQTLLTDQDNALVYENESQEASAYFARLAEYVIGGLLEAGFPPCPGGYMATNWHKPLAQWEQLFRDWIEKPEPEVLLEIQIFFDLRAIYGTLSLDPLQEIIQQSGNNRPFITQLAKDALLFRPPIGLFRQIRQGEEGVNLKKGGIAPLVSLARVYALEAGSRAKNTTERLEAAAQAKTLHPEMAETLVEAYTFLLRLRLREQLKDLRTGETISNRVRLEALSALERRHLKEAFLAIREAQQALLSHFHILEL